MKCHHLTAVLKKEMKDMACLFICLTSRTECQCCSLTPLNLISHCIALSLRALLVVNINLWVAKVTGLDSFGDESDAGEPKTTCNHVCSCKNAVLERMKCVSFKRHSDPEINLTSSNYAYKRPTRKLFSHPLSGSQKIHPPSKVLWLELGSITQVLIYPI